MNNAQSKIISKLKENGVTNLKAYGYPAVTVENITTDPIYSAFFEAMLEENIGANSQIDAAINTIIAEIRKDTELGGDETGKTSA